MLSISIVSLQSTETEERLVHEQTSLFSTRRSTRLKERVRESWVKAGMTSERPASLSKDALRSGPMCLRFVFFGIRSIIRDLSKQKSRVEKETW